MSVLIKGMEMPRNCWECRMCDWNETDEKPFAEYFCEITDKKIETEYKALSERLPDCPLVEVKAPHGRLIDRDAFAKTLADESDNENMSESEKTDGIRALNTFLDTYAPTVLEKELKRL